MWDCRVGDGEEDRGVHEGGGAGDNWERSTWSGSATVTWSKPPRVRTPGRVGNPDRVLTSGTDTGATGGAGVSVETPGDQGETVVTRDVTTCTTRHTHMGVVVGSGDRVGWERKRSRTRTLGGSRGHDLLRLVPESRHPALGSQTPNPHNPEKSRSKDYFPDRNVGVGSLGAEGSVRGVGPDESGGGGFVTPGPSRGDSGTCSCTSVVTTGTGIGVGLPEVLQRTGS